MRSATIEAKWVRGIGENSRVTICRQECRAVFTLSYHRRATSGTEPRHPMFVLFLNLMSY
jgi:hypothetical protein